MKCHQDSWISRFLQKIDRREFFRSEKCSFAAKEAGSEAGSPGLAPAEASTESALMGNLFSRAYAKFSFSAASGMNKVEGEKGTAERVQGKYEMKTKKTLKSMEKFGKTRKRIASASDTSSCSYGNSKSTTRPGSGDPGE